MKKINKFQAENCSKVNPIDTKNQSSFKGGRFPSSSFFSPSNTSKVIGGKINIFSPSKLFTSFADLRAFMLSGK